MNVTKIDYYSHTVDTTILTGGIFAHNGNNNGHKILTIPDSTNPSDYKVSCADFVVQAIPTRLASAM